MHLGRVIGTVVAERISKGLEGQKLLIVEPLDHKLAPKEPPVVAVDTVQAGTGDLIYFVTSREAALGLDPWNVPVDHTIVGVVDAVYPDEADRLDALRAKLYPSSPH